RLRPHTRWPRPTSSAASAEPTYPQPAIRTFTASLEARVLGALFRGGFAALFGLAVALLPRGRLLLRRTGLLRAGLLGPRGLGGLGARLLRRGLLLRALLLRGAALAPLAQELRRAVGGDALDRVALAERRHRLSVAHVRAEAPFANRDRLAAHGIGAGRAQGLDGAPLSALLGLREQLFGALERDREDLLLALEAARLLALLDVRPVAAVEREHRLSVVVDADRARKAQELERLLERHRRQRHALEERRRLRLLFPIGA